MYIPRHLNLQTYPKIQIDAASVIKPCVSSQTARESFIARPQPSWKPFLDDLRNVGFLKVIESFSNLKLPDHSTRPYKYYYLKAFKLLATILIYIHQFYDSTYTYLYPYSRLSYDSLCDEFAKCFNWSLAIIRAFAWHPSHDRCAIAICNDCIFIYENSTRIRLLRHHHQKKIVDLAWHPNNKEVLVVATQTNILLWRISEDAASNNQSSYLHTKTNFLNSSSGLKLIKSNDSNSSPTSNSTILKSTLVNKKLNFKLLENVLPAPIISIQFDASGDIVYACSPNTSKIAKINIKALFNEPTETNNDGPHITYLRKFGQGVTGLVWSPQKNRLATSTTSDFLRIFEPYRWSSLSWSTNNVIQDMVWSKPDGKVLLIATKFDHCLYALPFFDEPQAGDVGGNRSIMKVLDLSERHNDTNASVGGRVHSLVWDRNGKRLAISFKDNPDSVMLFKTSEKPTVEFHHINTIQSDNGSSALLMEFHDKFKSGSLLTICWSDGNCQHLPLTYSNNDLTRPNLSRMRDVDDSVIHHQGSPSIPRSLTSFCHVSRQPQSNNQTTLYTSTIRSPMSDESNDTMHSTEN